MDAIAPRRASPDVFADWRGVVNAALDALVEGGLLPADLDRSRVAVEPPRDARKRAALSVPSAYTRRPSTLCSSTS